MMGKQHAVMGAAGWVALAAPNPIGLGMIEASAITLIAGTIMARGAATLPDMDHTSASPTQALPPFTRWGISKLIGKVFGGHRNGTHAVLGIITFAVAAFAASFIMMPNTPFGNLHIGSVIAAGFLSVLALQVSGIKGLPGYALSALLGLLTVVGGPDNSWWIPLVVLVGAFIHSLGDFMTVAGINWVWPFVIKPKGGKDRHYGPIVHYKNGRWAMPIFGVTGEGAEPKHRRRLWWFMAILNSYVAIAIGIGMIATFMAFASGGNPLADPIGSQMSATGTQLIDTVKSIISSITKE